MTSFNKDLVVSTDRRFLNKEPASADLLQVVGLTSEWTDYVRVFDKNENLVLLHYLTVYNSVDDKTVNEEILNVIGHVRGIIINTLTNEIVCRSYDYTPEVVLENRDGSYIFHNYDNVKFYNACEGTIVRLFCFEGKWLFSTHRKIDANNSFWNGPTFGKSFAEMTDNSTFEDLDENLCYVFLMSHNANRLIYVIQESQLMLITVYDRQSKQFIQNYSNIKNPSFCVFPQALEIKNNVELFDIVNEMENTNRFDNAGIIAINNFKPVKFINKKYAFLKNIRGNVPNMKWRYLQLRGTKEADFLVDWYNDINNKMTFSKVEDEITLLIKKIHTMYINRYVNKNFGQLPKEEFVTLQRCHSIFLENRKPVRFDTVKEIINSTPSYYLQIMLNRK